MELSFTCFVCGLTRAPVTVRDREPEQTAMDWTQEVVQPAVLGAHAVRAPGCTGIVEGIHVYFPEGMRTIIKRHGANDG